MNNNNNPNNNNANDNNNNNINNGPKEPKINSNNNMAVLSRGQCKITPSDSPFKSNDFQNNRGQLQI